MLESATLQRIVHAAPGLFVLLAPTHDFTIIAASAEYLAATFKDESILGNPLFDVFPDNPALEGDAVSAIVRSSLERVLESGKAERMPVMRYDLPRPVANGAGFEERYWSPSNVPVFNDDGSLALIVHRMEEAAAKANLKAVEILESITEGFFTLDRQWRFDYVNSEAHRILEVEPGSLARQVIWDVYPGLEGTAFGDGYEKTMKERVKTSFTAFYANHERWYEVTIFPAAEGISIYFRNVTERKKFESQREALIRLSQRLADTHDAALASFEGAVILGTTLHAARVGYGTVDHDSGMLFVDRDWTKSGVQSLSGATPLLEYGTFLDKLRKG